MYSHADRYGGFRDYSSFPDQIGGADLDDFEFGRRGFRGDDFGRGPILHDDFGRRAAIDEFDYRLRSARIEYPGFPVREEDWRSSSHMRHREPTVEYESWKRGASESWASDRMTANANWRKEGSRPFRTSEDWRAESSWRRSPSPRRANTSSSHSLRRRSGSRYSPEREDMHRKSSSKGRKSRDKSATREEHSDHLKKGSIRSLDEDELEKAARLQLQLMAEMQSGESKQSPEKPEVTSKKGKEGVVNKEVESSKMGASSKKAKDSAPVTHSDTASPSQKKINPPETDFHSKAQPKEIDGKQPNSDVMPKTGQGETLVLKKNFEDIHMFPRAKVSGGLARSSTQKAWIEQYKMNVNKRKQGLCSGTPMPIARPSSPGRYDIHGGLVPRVPPRLPDYRSEASPTLEIRTATREYFQDPKRPPREEAVYVPAEEVTAKLPVPYATLDPKQFIEELSDSEDWEEVVQLVTKPSTLKRPAGVEIERPVKRGLLGTAPLPQNGPVVTSGRAVRPGLISPPVLTAKPTLPVPRSSVEEKSFFRMEYPSVTPKIYYSHPPIRDEHSNGSSEPAQARIAPAAPLPSEHDDPFNWRQEHAQPVPVDFKTKHAGVVSKSGGYFN